MLDGISGFMRETCTGCLQSQMDFKVKFLRSICLFFGRGEKGAKGPPWWVV